MHQPETEIALLWREINEIRRTRDREDDKLSATQKLAIQKYMAKIFAPGGLLLVAVGWIFGHFVTGATYYMGEAQKYDIAERLRSDDTGFVAAVAERVNAVATEHLTEVDNLIVEQLAPEDRMAKLSGLLLDDGNVAIDGNLQVRGTIFGKAAELDGRDPFAEISAIDKSTSTLVAGLRTDTAGVFSNALSVLDQMANASTHARELPGTDYDSKLSDMRKKLAEYRNGK